MNGLGKRLEPGDTIGIVAPSGPESREALEEQFQVLRDLGYHVKIGSHVFDCWGYLAGRDEDKAADLMQMFLDDSVDAVLCSRGGYGAMRMLPHVDLNVVKNHPKIFCGYSDITFLLNSFRQFANLVTFHGPVGTTKLTDVTLSSFLDTVSAPRDSYLIANPPSVERAQTAVSGTVEGELMGGNLELITSTLGTPYDLDFRGKILVLEEVNEEPYRVDRMLTHLLLAGKLQECAGFVLGQFTNCDAKHPESSLTLDEVIADRLLSLGKPTVTGMEFGHEYPKLTIPIGVRARLHADDRVVEVLEKVVR